MSGTDLSHYSPLPTAVLFDLDGTLIATRRLYVQSFADALEPVLGARPTEEELMRKVPRAERRFLAELAGRDHTPATLERFYESYRQRHERDFEGVYHGVRAVLTELRVRRVPLGIVTGKSRRSWHITGPRVELGAFRTTVFDEDVKAPKPDPDGLHRAVGELGEPPERVIYVGDSLTDLEAAAHAGLQRAAVLWSKKAEELEEFRAESLERGAILLTRPQALLQLVAPPGSGDESRTDDKPADVQV